MDKKPTIAIVGASSDRSKFGNRAVRAYAARGYEVYPIHPKEKSVEGHPAYPSVADVPLPKLDRVSFYVPPQIGITILEQLTQKQVGELWLNPGSESPELVARAQELGLPVIVGCSIIDIGVNPEQPG